MIKALAFTRYSIKSALANAVGRMVLTTLAVAAMAFAIVDISGRDWLATCQVILFGVFSVAGASLLYVAGQTGEATD